VYENNLAAQREGDVYMIFLRRNSLETAKLKISIDCVSPKKLISIIEVKTRYASLHLSTVDCQKCTDKVTVKFLCLISCTRTCDQLPVQYA